MNYVCPRVIQLFENQICELKLHCTACPALPQIHTKMIIWHFTVCPPPTLSLFDSGISPLILEIKLIISKCKVRSIDWSPPPTLYFLKRVVVEMKKKNQKKPQINRWIKLKKLFDHVLLLLAVFFFFLRDYYWNFWYFLYHRITTVTRLPSPTI